MFYEQNAQCPPKMIQNNVKPMLHHIITHIIIIILDFIICNFQIKKTGDKNSLNLVTLILRVLRDLSHCSMTNELG
jgi:nucleoside recognition membrane protein YjiH